MNDTVVERNSLSFHAFRAKFHNHDKKNDTLVTKKDFIYKTNINSF